MTHRLFFIILVLLCFHLAPEIVSAGTVQGILYYRDLHFNETQVIGFRSLPLRDAHLNLINQRGAGIDSSSTNEDGSFTLTFPTSDPPTKLEVCTYFEDAEFSMEILWHPKGNRRMGGKLICETISLAGIDPGGATSINAEMTNPAFNIFDVMIRGYDYVSGFGLELPISLKVWTPAEGAFFGKPGTIHIGPNDQFNDYVILHEFGHFVQYTLGEDLNEGGDHDGSFLLPPAMAFSEGWGSYFSSAVRLLDESASLSPPPCFLSWLTTDNRLSGIYDIESPTNALVPDLPSELSEFAVTASLFDLIDTPNLADCVKQEDFDGAPENSPWTDTRTWQGLLLHNLSDLKNLEPGETTSIEAFYRRLEPEVPPTLEHPRVPLWFATGTWQNEFQVDGPFMDRDIYYFEDGPYRPGGFLSLFEPNDYLEDILPPLSFEDKKGNAWLLALNDLPLSFTLVPSRHKYLFRPLQMNSLRPLADEDCFQVVLGPLQARWTEGDGMANGSRTVNISATLPSWFANTIDGKLYTPLIRIQGFQTDGINPIPLGDSTGEGLETILSPTVNIDPVYSEVAQDDCDLERERQSHALEDCIESCQNSGIPGCDILCNEAASPCRTECITRQACQDVCVLWRPMVAFCVSGLERETVDTLHYVLYQLNLTGGSNEGSCPPKPPCDCEEGEEPPPDGGVIIE